MFILYIFSTNIITEYFKHAAHSLFFSLKCRLFHNAIIFVSCIIHILHTECAIKDCKFVHHRTIQISYQSDSTIFSFYYPGVCLELNMFRAFFRPLSGAQWPQTQHDCHHDTKVKPEAATAVTELLTMGGKMPETCWAVNKGQDNKLKNCCIILVIYLN
jgi:hypothetical protein